MSEQGPNGPNEPPQGPVPAWTNPPGQMPPSREWTTPQAAFSSYQAGTPVPDYLVISVLATIFCCFPFGIAGVIYSARASGKKSAGDLAGASEDAASAKKMLFISAGVTLGVWGLAVVSWIFLVVVGIASQ